jgi:hypothetical protein
MERSLLILIPILRHRGPMRLLAINNDEELTEIMHRNYNAAQFNEDGEASCFTFEQKLQSLRWIDPRYSLHIINYSNDILPSQVPYQDEHGNDFCTKINLFDKYTPEEKCKEYEYRAHTIMGYY